MGKDKDKDATEQGVSEDDKSQSEDAQLDQDKKKFRGTAHSEMLDRIARQRVADFQKETGIDLQAEQTEEAENEDEQKAQQDQADKEQLDDDTGDQLEDTEERKAQQDEQLVKIKVDGKVKTVPLSKVHDAGMRALQKLESADQRLADSTKRAEQIVKEAEEQAKRILSKRAEDQDEDEDYGQEDEPKPKVDAQTEATLEEKREAYAHAIQYGTDAEVLDALKDYEQTSRKLMPGSSAVDIADIVRQVREDIEGEIIWENFNKDPSEGGFKDLLEDKRLNRWVYEEVNDLLSAGAPNKCETYKKAGETIRNLVGKDPQKPTVTMEERVERKRGIDNIPAVSAKTASTTREPKPRTTSEIIADMARSRPGQRVY